MAYNSIPDWPIAASASKDPLEGKSPDWLLRIRNRWYATVTVLKGFKVLIMR